MHLSPAMWWLKPHILFDIHSKFDNFTIIRHNYDNFAKKLGD